MKQMSGLCDMAIAAIAKPHPIAGVSFVFSYVCGSVGDNARRARMNLHQHRIAAALQGGLEQRLAGFRIDALLHGGCTEPAGAATTATDAVTLGLRAPSWRATRFDRGRYRTLLVCYL